MFDWVPAKAWLLMLAAISAFVPARYVFRHLRHAPNRRDVTLPLEDLSWRSQKQFTISILALGILVAFSLFIFTPTAARVAGSPHFFPVLIFCFGIWMLGTVVRGYSAGKIEPMSRGSLGPFARTTQPKRFWASMAWNGGMGCILVWAGASANVDADRQALINRCYDEKDQQPYNAQIAACSVLIDEQSDGDRDRLASLLAARGTAYRDQHEWKRAFVDYSRAISLNPSAAIASYAYFYRADIFLYRYQLPPALNDLTSAIQLTPDESGIYGQRAWVYEHLGDQAHAAADRHKVAELQAEHPTIVKKDASAI